MQDASTTSTRRLQVMRMLWFSLVMSTVFLLVALQLLRVNDDEPFELAVTLLLAGAALFAWVLSLVLPAAMRRGQIRAAGYPTREQPVASGDGDYRSAPAVRRVFADQAACESTAWAGYQTTLVLGMALAEVPALLGFVLAFRGAPMAFALPLFVLAWSAMATKFPTQARFVGPLEATTGAHWHA